MSGGHDRGEAAADMSKWKKISLYVALPGCAAMTVINFGMHMTEEHPHYAEEPSPSYMRIRSKPYPWSCPDCGLFEGPCWEKCKAAKAAGL